MNDFGDDQNDMHDDLPGDWQALGEDWRAQAISAIDIDALRREVHKRGRRLRWALANDLLGFAATIGLSLWAMLTGRAGLPHAVIITLIVTLCGFQAWSLWIRRRLVGDSGLSAAAMVELEIARARSSLHYWRVSIWLGVAIWLGLYAFVLQDGFPLSLDHGVIVARKIIVSLGVAATTGLGFALWAWWLGGRTRKRLKRMLSLREALRK